MANIIIRYRPSTIENIDIADHVAIDTGASVIVNIDLNTTYVGVPAKKI